MESSLLSSLLGLFRDRRCLLLNGNQNRGKHRGNLEVAHEARVLNDCCGSLQSLILYSNMQTVDAQFLCRETEEEGLLQQLIDYLASPLLSIELVLFLVEVSELYGSKHEGARDPLSQCLLEIILYHQVKLSLWRGPLWLIVLGRLLNCLCGILFALSGLFLFRS